MKRTVERFITYFLVLSIAFGSPTLTFGKASESTPAASSGGQAATKAPPPPDPNEPWPRVTTYQGATISIFQPQLESWTGNQIKARAAVRVKSTSSTDYGVIWLAARTEVDKVNRVVTLSDVSITNQKFPTLPTMATSTPTRCLRICHGTRPCRSTCWKPALQ